MPESEARKQTEMLMDIRETVQSYGIAYYADGTLKTVDQYNYEPWQKKKLIDAWMPIIQQQNIKVNPFVNVIAAEAICTGPLLGLMINNRKQRKQIAILMHENQRLNDELKAKANQRNDNKSAWSIDANGYFTYTPALTYIKVEDRREKPEINSDTWPLLVKHNGEAAVKKAFNIE